MPDIRGTHRSSAGRWLCSRCTALILRLLASLGCTPHVQAQASSSEPDQSTTMAPLTTLSGAFRIPELPSENIAGLPAVIVPRPSAERIRTPGRATLATSPPAGAHDGCRRGDLHMTVWLSCSTRFPLTIKPPTAWRCAGRRGMDMVTSVPGDVERTSNFPPDASTLARIDAIPI